MRKIVDDKLDYIVYGDIDILTYDLLEKAYRSCCYGSIEPKEMEVSENMWNFLKAGIFRDFPHIKEMKKFHGANINTNLLQDNQINFNRLSSEPVDIHPNFKDRVYKFNCKIYLNL